MGTGILGVDFHIIGWKNYLQLFTDPNFSESFLINLAFIGITVTGQILLGILMALMLYFGMKGNSVIGRTITFIPVILPTVAVAQMFVKIFETTPQLGLFNAILQSIGLNDLITAWHGDHRTALAAVSIAAIWKGFGFHAIILYAGLTAISNDVIEAAKIDGANGLRLIWEVVLPLLAPVIITCLVLSVTGCLKEFEMPFVLTAGGPGRTTTLVAMYMYNTAFLYNDYGYGSSIAIFLLVEGLGFTYLINHLTKTRLDY
jgi:ABC-type sugar transport system permease subunit